MELAITPKYSWNQIPTGEIIVQIKVKFRSPRIDIDYFAYYVYDGGYLGNSYVYWDSCGRSSPRTDFGHVTCFVYLTGDIYVSGYGVDSYSGGRSSPYTNRVIDAYDVHSDGRVGDVVWRDFGGRRPALALRTPTTNTPALSTRTVCTWMAPSATTISMCIWIPAGSNILHQKKWIFHSPDVNRFTGRIACLVKSDGIVDGYSWGVTDSYGIRSPNFGNVVNACWVYPYGDVDYGNYVDWNSCG